MARILIVDDHVLNRDFLSTLLGYGGHHLSEAADGEAGLRQAHSLRPHLIIAPVLMPGMNGQEFVTRLKADPGLASIPVIFCTAAYGEREATVMARACGVRWVMCWPAQPQQVLRIVREALGEGHELDDEPVLDLPTARSVLSADPLQDYLQVAETSSQLMDRLLESSASASPAQEQLQRMSQRLAGSLASLQAVSLRLSALIELGIELATERDPDDMLHLACRVAHNMCVSSNAAIGIVDDSGARLSHYIVRGSDAGASREQPPPAPDFGLAGSLLRQRDPIRLADTGSAATGGLPLAGSQRHSFLGVAIASPTRIYGWLVLTGKLGAAEFSDVDERVTTTVAAQLAVAWENLVLYREVARQHEALKRQAEERRTIDEDLRRFRLAMDATSDAIMLIDPVGLRFIDFNDATCRLFGYSAEELRRLGPVAMGTRSEAELRKLYAGVIEGDERHTHAEISLQRKDGTPVMVEVKRRALQSGAGSIIVAVARDLTEREAERERTLKLAHYDTLTGLPNRVLFVMRLRRALEQAQPGTAVVLLLLDLDRFQKVNDTMGHAKGDELLRQVADRLLQSLRKPDAIGRLGADEFGIILAVPRNSHEETVVMERIREALAPRFAIGGAHTTVTASIGIAIYPDDADTAEALLKYADTAMHWAKKDGRNVHRYFTAEMHRLALARLELENALRNAIEGNEFRLMYQPKASIASATVAGAEVLLRWERPGFGYVSPSLFIPLLEDTGLIVQVGAWVIEETCRVLKSWREAGRAQLQLSFNVSARQFFDIELEQLIKRALSQHQVDPQLLMLELTESALMSDVEQSASVLASLKHLGLDIALDDFGTGYSSLAYLRRFPIDTLKIDIAFIRELSSNPEDAAIVAAVIEMAHSLTLNVVAEGVEDAAQLAWLREHGCDQIQGYWYSKPLSEAAFLQLVDDQVPLKS
ncbi:MAG: diguanylate cyclase [Paucimonas sp.]|nr:diguanylate cyclase [Paucimonas sp.]